MTQVSVIEYQGLLQGIIFYGLAFIAFSMVIGFLLIMEYFERGSLSGIENMDQGMVVEAKPDSYWNMVILNGFLLIMEDFKD